MAPPVRDNELRPRLEQAPPEARGAAATPAPTSFEETPMDDMVCSVCGSGHDEELLLLCDVCNGARHTYCCSPPLLQVPEGDFICPDCSLEGREEALANTVQAATDVPVMYEKHRSTGGHENTLDDDASLSISATLATQSRSSTDQSRFEARISASMEAEPSTQKLISSGATQSLQEDPSGRRMEPADQRDSEHTNESESAASAIGEGMTPASTSVTVGASPSRLAKAAGALLDAESMQPTLRHSSEPHEHLEVGLPPSPLQVSRSHGGTTEEAVEHSMKAVATAVPSTPPPEALTLPNEGHERMTRDPEGQRESSPPKREWADSKVDLGSVDWDGASHPIRLKMVSTDTQKLESASLDTKTFKAEAQPIQSHAPSTSIADSNEAGNESAPTSVQNDPSSGASLVGDMATDRPDDTAASARTGSTDGSPITGRQEGPEPALTDALPAVSSGSESASLTRPRRSSTRDTEAATCTTEPPLVKPEQGSLEPRSVQEMPSVASSRLTRRIMPRVGEAFQVPETSIPPIRSIDEKGATSGTTGSAVSEQVRHAIRLELAEYLEEPSSALWHPGMVPEPLLRSYLEKCSAHIEERWGLPATAEQQFVLYCILKEQHYNVDAAYRVVCETQRLAPSVVDSTAWGSEDRSLFARGIFEYGKQFALIRRYHLPHRSVQELVRYYFRKYKQLVDQQMNSASADFGHLYDHGEEPVPHARPFPSRVFVNMLRMQVRTSGDGFPFPGWFRTHLLAVREVRRLRTVEALGRSFTAR
ncbi:hypothetical protein CCYA_CCYA01G0415 [Cyanidiococcus yangmingshanensis]|nr:hypothetical protein CCYA_CCYA01G0415 [Cyanidiococcus yangmingshanensis]